jgi:hypothetical protein
MHEFMKEITDKLVFIKIKNFSTAKGLDKSQNGRKY